MKDDRLRVRHHFEQPVGHGVQAFEFRGGLGAEDQRTCPGERLQGKATRQRPGRKMLEGIVVAIVMWHGWPP